jgi:tRNA A37 threonylcarbamoyladenosine dehydratase
MFTIGDIKETGGCGCPVARIMRREMKKRDIDELLVVYSTEKPMKFDSRVPASISFVPPVAGYLMCSALLNKEII